MKNRLRRRGLSLLLAAALLLGVFPATAFAIDGNNGSNGLDLTTAQDGETFTCGSGTAHWEKDKDPKKSDTFNLTLDNATIDGTVILPVGDGTSFITVNMIIKGKNTITANGVPVQGGDDVYVQEETQAAGSGNENSLTLTNSQNGSVILEHPTTGGRSIMIRPPQVDRYLEIKDDTGLVHGGAYPGEKSDSTTTHTIWEQEKTLTITYKEIPSDKPYVLTVYDGTGAGTYAAGDRVPISCPDEISRDMGEGPVEFPFLNWNYDRSNGSTGSVKNPYQANTIFIMGEEHSSAHPEYLMESYGCWVTYKPNYTTAQNDVWDGPFDPYDPEYHDDKDHTTKNVTILKGDIFDAPQGKVFTGWSLTPSGDVKYTGGQTGVDIESDIGDITTPGINLVLYAIWNDIPTYAVTYESNYPDSSGPAAVQDKGHAEGSDVTLKDSSLFEAPKGMKFAGWATSEGGPVEHEAGTIIKMPAENITLYAVWEYIPYSVTYKANYTGGPLDVIDSNTYQIGDSVTVRGANTFTAPENMRFAGWSTKKDSSKGEYKAGDTFKIEDKDVILYAIWERTYTLTYAPNFKDSTESDISAGSYAAGDPVTALGSDAFTSPKDKTFAGWAASESGPIFYLAGESFNMPPNDLKLYAVWIGDGDNPTYSVTYKPNFTGSTDNDKVTGPFAAGDTVTTLAGDTFKAPSGKTFSGWAESADGTVKYKAGVTFPMPEAPVVLYAVWRNQSSGSSSGPSTYSVVYKSNYEKGPSDVRDPGHRSGDEVTIKEGSIFQAPEGMTFAGWAESKDGTVKYQGGDTLEMSAKTVTLFAIWQEKQGKGDSGPLPTLNEIDHTAYMEGFPDGTIHPEAFITREQTAAIFYRLMDEATRTYYHSTDSPFTDVENSRWSAEAIATMANAGILKGLSDRTFNPESPITRAEFATIAARFSSDSYSGPDLFIDIAGHWAAEDINRAAQKGWVKGGKDGRFRPDDYITRAEAVAFINRVLKRAPQTAEDLLPGMKTFSDNADELAWYYLDLQEAANGHDYERKADGVHEMWTELNENN